MTAPLKVRDLLVRGMLAGLVAGLVALAFAAVFGEPEVDNAIAFEEATAEAAAHAHGEGEEAEAPPVGRDTQKSWGLATGIGMFGVAFGGVFALVFAAVHGRIGRVRPRVTSAMLAGAAFVTVSLVPWLKYPATPPAVGDPETSEKRMALFLVMVAVSVVAGIAATSLGRSLKDRLGSWSASLVAGGAFIILVGGIQLLLPTVNEIPDRFPADVLWRFRLAAIGIHAVLWAALGLSFGTMVERSLQPAKAPAPAAASRTTA